MVVFLMVSLIFQYSKHVEEEESASPIPEPDASSGQAMWVLPDDQLKVVITKFLP